tara:strand:- start:24 stop:524 length:501 start_codon:yes stop_codon:yes gene_type:complete
MASTIEKFDSAGGFSVDKTVVVDEDRNAKDINSLEIKNSFYTDSKSSHYILRGLNTAVLQLDNVGGQIDMDNNTLNFITAHIIGTNPQGDVYSAKIESTVIYNASGIGNVLSSMRTVIKDDIPAAQTWDIVPLAGTNLFSYSTTRAGTTNNIKWVASTQVVTIEWA